MKALTLYQPWASLIVAGLKTVETRNWPPPDSVLGQRIAIHIGTARVRVDPELQRSIASSLGRNWSRNLPRGTVVATAVVSGRFYVLDTEPDCSLRCAGTGRDPGVIRPDPYGDFRRGRWLWTLEEVCPVKPPLPARGSHKLWELPPGFT